MKPLPRIIAIAAVTIDGKIALDAGHSSDWTSPEDKDFLHNFLDKSDVIVVGNNTYKTSETPLSKRNCIVLTHSVVVSEQRGKNLIFCNPKGSSIQNILSEYKTVALLGGTQTYTYFLENDLIDEIYLTIEPVVFGRGLGLFESHDDAAMRFQLISVDKLNTKGTTLLHYKKSDQ